MSPILDLQNLTPISLEELGEPNKETKQELDKPIESSLIIEAKEESNQVTSTEKNDFIINKTKKNNNKTKPQTSSDSSLFTLHSSLPLLSIKECESLSGISKVSIRKAIKEKEINYTLEDGKYKIPFKELLKWCYASTRRKNVFNTQGVGKYVETWKMIV